MAALCEFVVVISLLLAFCWTTTCEGVFFSSLKETLILTASPARGQVLKAGKDKITLTWSYNKTFPTGTDSNYKTLKFQLCYAPISQKDRGWRKTNDDLKKDKTCQFDIGEQPYPSTINTSYTWTVEKDVPTATYFVRVYALDSAGEEAGYGQSSSIDGDDEKRNMLFKVEAISGRHATLDICSGVFSAFSIVSFFGFFFMDKRKAKANRQK